MCKGTEAGESTVGPENPYGGHACKEFEVCLSVSLKQGAGNEQTEAPRLRWAWWLQEVGGGGWAGRGQGRPHQSQGCGAGKGGRRLNVLISTSGSFIERMAKNSKRHKHGRGDDLGPDRLMGLGPRRTQPAMRLPGVPTQSTHEPAETGGARPGTVAGQGDIR